MKEHDFKIYDNPFHHNQFDNHPFWDNWPMLYILENGKQAYIGESNHVKTRMAQHLSNNEKRIFKEAHFIYSKIFNQSVTFDYESKLILYISSDQKYQVTNRNIGIADKNYFEKDKYDAKFEELWEELRKKQLVKHSIIEIENSDLFKYSPYKELNDEQRYTADSILSEIVSGNSHRLIVEGIPGSGKTIIAVYLMKYLSDADQFKGKNIGFVVPQTSLRKTMKSIFRSIYGLSSSQVIGPSDVTKKKYDVLIVDEAHRLHQYKNIANYGSFKENCKKLGLSIKSDELDWIYHQSEYTVVFYDPFQVIGPSGIDKLKFQSKLTDPNIKTSHFELFSQMRVQGGTAYIQFVNDLLCANCKQKYQSNVYTLKLVTDFKDFNNLQQELEQKYSLSRMVAGYAWPWISKHDYSKDDIVIDGIAKKWNHCTEGWITTPSSINEVGCIHSIQGFDLNYAFVILGNDIGYDKTEKKIIIRKDNYFDKNGKNTATDDELLNYIKHIYYVLLTRGIMGTFIYCCDKNLKDYLSHFIEIYNKR